MPEQNLTRQSLRATGLWLGVGFGLMTLLAIVPAIFPDSGLHTIFSSVCHQQPGRSHMIDGIPFGVCIRCFWLYAGLSVAHLRFALFPAIPNWRLPFLIATLGLAGVNWLSGWIDLGSDAALIRAASSALIAVAVSHYTVPGVTELIFSSSNSNPNLTKPHGLKHS